MKSLAADVYFDVAIVDPPTFSNQKGQEQDWDVQNDHVELLSLLQRHLSPNGVVFFSTNFRQFKFSADALTGYKVREISKQTVPEDFRNRRIHQCWRLDLQ